MVMPRDHVKIIGKDIHCPIKYKYAGVPGIDRRVNALAAIERYKTELIVVSAGSAITIDLVTETDGMLGGFILPGFRWAFRAVTENAELVNHQLIFNELASASLGYDTATCLSLGIRQGLAGAVDALIDRIQTHLAVNLVILTGGDARLLAGSMRADYCVDDDLTFHGIACCLDEVEKPE
jgi:type III pantothenate kinase